jgi:hypothetical protein
VETLEKPWIIKMDDRRAARAPEAFKKLPPSPSGRWIMILGGLGKEAAMAEKTMRCLVCGKPDTGGDSICPRCKAQIRGEALVHQKEVMKEADKALHKEGTEIAKRPLKAA